MVDRRARERRAGRRAVEGRAPTALHENSATCSRLNSPAPCRDAWGRRRSQQARASTIFRTPQARRPHTELHRRDLSSAILAALRSGQPTPGARPTGALTFSWLNSSSRVARGYTRQHPGPRVWPEPCAVYHSTSFAQAVGFLPPQNTRTMHFVQVQLYAGPVRLGFF